MTSSSTPTSTTIITSVGFITPTQLHQMMQDKPCAVQIVDSRSFLNYNTERITGSVNIYCPPLVKRRFQTFLPLTTMLTRETKAMLCRTSVDTVVVHDQFTDEAMFRMGQSDLQLVLRSLVKFLGHRCYLILAGGYFQFRQEWPGMCSSHTSLSGQLCHVTRLGSSKQILSPNSPNTLQALQLSTAKTQSLFTLTPVELMPYLYIGDAVHSSRIDLLRKFHITAILNVSTSCENHFPNDFRYKVIPVEDSSSANLLEWFQDAILFIEHEKNAGGKVLVHCHGGISRSATVCLAYLMYTRHLILDEAFEYVKSRRHIISPNANFMMQLSQFEQELGHLGFITSTASLQKPLSPRILSSVVSCPDMGHFLNKDVEMNEEEEEKEEAEDKEKEVLDKNGGIHREHGYDRFTEETMCDADNNNGGTGTGSEGVNLSCSDKNDNTKCIVGCHNGNGVIHIGTHGNEDDDSSNSNNNISFSSHYSNLKHSSSTPYLSTTLSTSS